MLTEHCVGSDVGTFEVVGDAEAIGSAEEVGVPEVGSSELVELDTTVVLSTQLKQEMSYPWYQELESATNPV